ncbi:MAG: family 31 glucosidase [Lachnospiraceae bacterium]|nr:family 31 glucosidase [Lachnospiraceae bacterium]
MFFTIEDDSMALIGKNENETLRIEPWGQDALRVRATLYPRFTGNDWALSWVKPGTGDVSARILPEKAVVCNGKIRAEVTNFGKICFYLRGELPEGAGEEESANPPQQRAETWEPILSEYYRTFGGDNPHTPSMKLVAREFVPIHAGDYRLNMRFESRDDEKIFGMGQYQQEYLDLKGCVLELAQRNTQISIPFALSSLGYGFLWNNAGVGRASFGKNFTEWHSESTEELDYLVIAGDTPKDIMRNYTELVGRAPVIPENVLGLWQSKLRYRTQDELLEVAREYHRRGIPLDVIVVDFFHWVRQGDWAFDPEYWPDPQAMAEELHGMGTRLMVSIWPTVDRQSVHFEEMRERGLLIRTERGSRQNFDFLGDTVIYDATNPEARKYIWEKCKESYYDSGVDMFWLDEAEPEFAAYTFDHFRYYEGPDVKVGNAYPMFHAKAFYDGQIAAGQKDVVNLLRSAWVGSQKYAAVVWSGDIYGNFAALRDQLAAGLNIGLAGIPWWTTDTGGFFADVTDPGYRELLVRWFEFSAFSPILRLHGDRGPHDIPPLAENTMVGGGFCSTGRPNELWSYGEDVYEILKKYVDIRLAMKDYLLSVMEEAHENGSPVIRTMFYEFPEDPVCWNLTEQYMLGPSCLVAPVLYEGQRKKQVYFPKGEWESIHDHTIFCGPQMAVVEAPLDIIPVFRLAGSAADKGQS